MLLTYTLLINSNFSTITNKIKKNQQLFNSPYFISYQLIPSNIKTKLNQISYNTKKPILYLKILYINTI